MKNNLSLTAFPMRNDLFYPDLNRNISKIMPTLLTLFDRRFPENRTLKSSLSKNEGWKRVQESDISNIILITLDALGLKHFLRYSTWLKTKFDTNGMVLSSVFPTITSTCLTSIHLGVMPIEHGILGHKIRFQEIDNVVDTLTLRTDSLAPTRLNEIGINVKSWLWSPFIIKQDDDFRFHDLIEAGIANNGLSHFLYEKVKSIGYASHVDCFNAAKRILEKIHDQRLLLSIYSGAVDSISHRYSPDSEALDDEVKNIEQILHTTLIRLNSTLRKKTAIIIAADHGQENLTERNKINVTSEEEEYLTKVLRARGRSGRVIHLYSKEGRREEVVNWALEKIGDKGVVLTPEDYPKIMGRGVEEKRAIERIGDVQIILGKEAALYYGHTGDYDPEFNMGLNATHGSLSENELLVPFIFGTADDLLEVK